VYGLDRNGCTETPEIRTSVGHDKSAIDLLLGAAGALIVGLVLMPGWTFVWSTTTYEWRQLRRDVGAVMSHLGVAQSDSGAPAARPRPALAIELEPLIRRGERLKARGPEYRAEHVSPNHQQELATWEQDVHTASSASRPDLAKEFEQPRVVSTLDQMYHPFSQELSLRLSQLAQMIVDIEAQG
jgi:hypothetical protein